MIEANAIATAATATVPGPLHHAHAPGDEVEAIMPPLPASLRETGLERHLILSLLAKTIAGCGRAHLPVLAGKLRLSMSVLREAVAMMLADQLIEVARCGDSDIDIEYQLTGAGQAYAASALAQSPYVGPAPVTIEAFCAVVARSARRHAASMRCGDAELAAALSDGPGDDVIAADVRVQLGAALHSGRAVLLHGAPGCGKSVLAGKLVRLLQGVVAVPYAVLVERQIVQFYDPLVHRTAPPSQARQFDERRNDSRWLLCQRPLVRLDGGLTLDMLDCRFDAANGLYHMPPQLQASGGLLIVDDLGDQRGGARALLQRLAGPLERGADMLRLRDGRAISVPFAATTVFTTSHAPHTLLDAAARRRIAYRIALGPLDAGRYRALLRRECGLREVAYDDTAASYLLERLHAPSAQPLLAYLPRELLGRVVDAASFAGISPRLSTATLEQAWRSLFACCPPLTTVSPAADHVLLGEQA